MQHDAEVRKGKTELQSAREGPCKPHQAKSCCRWEVRIRDPPADVRVERGLHGLGTSRRAEIASDLRLTCFGVRFVRHQDVALTILTTFERRNPDEVVTRSASWQKQPIQAVNLCNHCREDNLHPEHTGSGRYTTAVPKTPSLQLGPASLEQSPYTHNMLISGKKPPCYAHQIFKIRYDQATHGMIPRKL